MCWLSKLLNRPGSLVFPDPPKSTVTIDANHVSELLRPYGITISGTTGDFTYLLMTRKEANRFMRWYKKNAPIKPGDYTQDDLDCDDFAWIMRAYALIWSKGRYLWGYIEAEGADSEYHFPNHGFCFTIIDDYQVYYADQLSVAAPDDEVSEAFPVKSYAAKC